MFSSSFSKIALPVLVFLILLGLDQGSKRMAKTRLLLWEKLEAPTFYTATKKEILAIGNPQRYFYIGFSYVRNFAAAFDGKDSLNREFSSKTYSIIAGLALILGLGIYLYFRSDFSLTQNLSCIAIFSGMAGNLCDRLLLGFVVDIIEIRWRFSDSPSMLPHANFADVFMLVGFGVIMLSLLRSRPQKSKNPEAIISRNN